MINKQWHNPVFLLSVRSERLLSSDTGLIYYFYESCYLKYVVMPIKAILGSHTILARKEDNQNVA